MKEIIFSKCYKIEYRLNHYFHYRVIENKYLFENELLKHKISSILSLSNLLTNIFKLKDEY